MSEITGQSILDICTNQGVKPARLIGRALRGTLKEDGGPLYTPTPALSAIAAAARIRRKNPGLQLANAPLRLPEEAPQSPTLETFVSVINDSLEPRQLDDTIASFDSVRSISDFWACQAAEENFAYATNRIERLLAGSHSFASAQIVIDHNDQPLIMNKGEYDGARTGLSLVPTNVDGIEWPAGVILKSYFPPKKEGSRPALAQAPVDRVEVVSADKLAGIAIGRLSLFAFHQEDRAEYFPYHPLAKKMSVQIMDRFDLDNIKTIAKEAAKYAIRAGNIAV